MKSASLVWACCTALLAVCASPVLVADQTIRCESHKHAYKTCRVDTHGYVYLARELSKGHCQQGRTWDYDQRGIWVDDNCKGEFVVEARHHTGGHKDHHGKEAVAAAAAIALIAAATAAADHNDHKDRYHDDDYHRGGHASYMPHWMVGSFKGYNLQFGANVRLRIDEDGRAVADVEGQRVRGYVNDGRLYVGDAEFDIERAGEGFNTVQRGNRSNRVHYERD